MDCVGNLESRKVGYGKKTEGGSCPQFFVENVSVTKGYGSKCNGDACHIRIRPLCNIRKRLDDKSI